MTIATAKTSTRSFKQEHRRDVISMINHNKADLPFLNTFDINGTKYALPSLNELMMELSYRSLYHFIGYMWKEIETATYVDGWHIRAIAEHLQAVTEGNIRHLMINMPPRCQKSLSVAVFWPAWEWLHMPHQRYLFSSYANSLSIRDSVKCRRLIQSPKYQALLQKHQPDFCLYGDQNTKVRYDNTYGGYRLATSVGGANTGEGGNRVVADDPHNVVKGESDSERQATIEWWDWAMSSRLNDPKEDSFVLVGQRIHQGDLFGHMLAKHLINFSHLILPMRFEGEKERGRCVTAINFRDPRTEVGQLLWPERWGEEEVKSLETALGQYGTASQLAQRPAPREGGMFKINVLLRHVIEQVDASQIVKSVRYWDKAATQGGGCNSAGVLIHEMKDHTFVIADVIAGKWSALEREERMQQTAKLDGRRVRIWTEQEPGSGGKESAENTIRNLRGFVVKADRVTGDKVSRAEPFAAQVEAGNVSVLNRAWLEPYKQELELFPNGNEKDRVDASSGAFNMLNVGRTIRPHVGSEAAMDEVVESCKDEIKALLASASNEAERKAMEALVKQAIETGHL